MAETVLSGLRPTGRVHLGNYFGAVKNWVDLEKSGQLSLLLLRRGSSRPDDGLRRHAGARRLDPRGRARLARGRARPGAGDDVSAVPRGAACGAGSLLLDDHAPRLARAGADLQGPDRAAALARPRHARVPRVSGSDDGRHRALPRATSCRWGRTSRAISRSAARSSADSTACTATSFRSRRPSSRRRPKVNGIDGRKMSKSYGNTIGITEGADAVREKVMAMVTDPARVRRQDPGNPQNCNLFPFHELFSPPAEVEVVDEECRTAARGCVDCKKHLDRQPQRGARALPPEARGADRVAPRTSCATSCTPATSARGPWPRRRWRRCGPPCGSRRSRDGRRDQRTFALPPVAIAAFSGPLDLLLHLIRVNEVSITDIPIAEITEQYTAYLDAMRELDLDVASEYVALAAELIYIKSRMLLPRAPGEPRQSTRGRTSPSACSTTKSSSARPRRSTRSTRCAEGSGRAPRRRFPAPRATEESLEVSLFDIIEAFRQRHREATAWRIRRPWRSTTCASRWATR